VSPPLRREAKNRLSAQALFAESLGSSTKLGPTAQSSFAESVRAPALGEGPAHGGDLLRRECEGPGSLRRIQVTGYIRKKREREEKVRREREKKGQVSYYARRTYPYRK
jgi:hypothetical protein